MCVHAALNNLEHTPRIYITENQHLNPDLCWENASICLLSDYKAIHNWTLSVLELLRISIKDLNNLTSSDKLKNLNMIESSLDMTLGKGTVYYESLRFTPFLTENNRLDFLLKNCEPKTKWQTVLLQRLKTRDGEQLEYCTKHRNFITDVNFKHNCDIYHSVYKLKLEQRWQCSWLSAEKYDNSPDIINSIMIGDSFDE